MLSYQKKKNATKQAESFPGTKVLTLLHTEIPKLYGVLDVLSAIGLNKPLNASVLV